MRSRPASRINLVASPDTIEETCGCGASIRLTGRAGQPFGIGYELRMWRDKHSCSLRKE